VAALYGPEGKHNTGRAGCWHGSEAGSVTLGGRRVPVTRPRVRAANGSGELHLSSYDLFSSAKVLGRLAMEKMLAGLSSRRTGPVTVRPARTAGPATPTPDPERRPPWRSRSRCRPEHIGQHRHPPGTCEPDITVENRRNTISN